MTDSGGESEQWYATADGGLIVYADGIGLFFEAPGAALTGALPVDFSALRSVVLYPDGTDRGSVAFELAVTDTGTGRVVERTVMMRVSAEDGLNEAQIFCPELHMKAAGLKALPSPDLDMALFEADRQRARESTVPAPKRNAVQDLDGSAEIVPQPKTARSSAVEVLLSSRLDRPSRRWQVLIAAAAAAGLVAFAAFQSVRTAGPEDVIAAPVQTTGSTTSAAATSTALVRTSPPSSTRSSPTAASSTDALFVSTLTDLGVEYSSSTQAVATAKSTCRTIDNSPDPVNAILAASEIAQRTDGYTRTQANDFVGLAVLVYCFEYNEYVRF